MLSQTDIQTKFSQCIHCSQIVLMEWAEELGYQIDEAAHMAAPFGGGMFRGDTCGSVSGAMMAIGVRYGHYKPGDFDGNNAMIEKVKEFQDAFVERHGSLECRDLCGYDFSQPGEREKAMASGTVLRVCPDFVISALEILSDIM